MHRFAIFVDGSNLQGSLDRLGINIDNYEHFFNHIFRGGLETWRKTWADGGGPEQQLHRVYWYRVGSIDKWNLDDPETRAHLRTRFTEDSRTRNQYLATVGPAHPGVGAPALEDLAWEACMADARGWYRKREERVRQFKRFHYGIMSTTDFIDIIECGHMKVNVLRQAAVEKGIDTRLAVDMIALCDAYDVCIVVTGDADGIPSIEHIKRRGKHVGVVEFLKGSPPEARDRGSSSMLKIVADFVVPVYETSLLREKWATRRIAGEARAVAVN